MAIIAVVDATNLERNLYLVTQLFDYRIPVVVALTMIDSAEKQSLAINDEKLSELLAVPVVPITAASKRGLEKLKESVIQTLKSPSANAWQNYKSQKFNRRIE